MQAVIRFLLIWQGSTISSRYTDSVRVRGPISMESRTKNMTDMDALAAAYGTPFFAKGPASILFGVSLRR